MRSNIFDFTKNYWTIFSEVLIIEEFKKFYDEDKSKDKNDSSAIMWAMHLCMNPNSMIYNDPNKWEAVKKSVVRNEKHDWKKYKELITKYEELVMSPAEKYFHMFNEILENKKEYLKNFDYATATEASIKLVETMTINLYKVGLEFDKVKKLLREEYAKQDEKKKSLLESDEL